MVHRVRRKHKDVQIVQSNVMEKLLVDKDALLDIDSIIKRINRDGTAITIDDILWRDRYLREEVEKKSNGMNAANTANSNQLFASTSPMAESNPPIVVTDINTAMKLSDNCSNPLLDDLAQSMIESNRYDDDNHVVLIHRDVLDEDDDDEKGGGGKNGKSGKNGNVDKRRNADWNRMGVSVNLLNNSIPSIPISNQQNQQNQCDRKEGICQTDRIEQARLENDILAQLASQRAVVIRPADVRVQSHSPTVDPSPMRENGSGSEERERNEERRERLVNRRQRSYSPRRSNAPPPSISQFPNGMNLNEFE